MPSFFGHYDKDREIHSVFGPQDPRIVIVGNASDLNRHTIGGLIDEYDVVVRINFPKLGYEEQAGTKGTHWVVPCTTFSRDFLSTDYEYPYKDTQEVWFRISWGEKSEVSDKSVPEDIFQLTRPLPYHLLEEDQFLFTAKLMGFSPPVHPTTGLLAIVFTFYRWGVPVHLAGFGSSHTHSPGHYYSEHENLPERPDDPVPHDMDLERRIINRLEQTCFVKRIDQQI